MTTSAAPAAPSQSGVHDVQVGADGKLAYDPSTVMAAMGEKVRFWFNPRNHSVVQSSFDKPCVPLSATSIFSGFQPVSSGQGVKKKRFFLDDRIKVRHRRANELVPLVSRTSSP
jgi:plastocyanin